MTPSDESKSGAAAGAIIFHLGTCLRVAAMYDLSNASVNGPIESLVAAVNAASRDGGTTAIQAVQDKFFFNKRFVRQDAAAFEQTRPLLQIFKRLRINEIAFSAVKLEVRQVRDFLLAFKRYFPTAEPWMLAKESFDAIAVRTIDGTEADAFEVELSAQQQVLRQYALLMVYLARVTAALKLGTPTRLAGLRRMLQALSDACEGQEAFLVAATSFDQFARRPHAHQARCAAFVLLMGKNLGLSRASLIDVALAALFHDVARPEPGEAASAAAGAGPLPVAPGGTPRAARDEIRQTSLGSMLRMCRSGVGLDSHLRLAVAREVWSALDASPGPSLPARLVAVPCAFDLLTRTTATHVGLAPSDALRVLLSRAGSRYDVRAIRTFAATIGVYPAGTVLDLSDGSVAVVVDGVSPSGGTLPVVQVIRGGQAVPEKTPVDLSSPGAKLTIRGCVDRRERGVNVVRALMS